MGGFIHEFDSGRIRKSGYGSSTCAGEKRSGFVVDYGLHPDCRFLEAFVLRHIFGLVCGSWYFMAVWWFFKKTNGRWKWETTAFVVIGLVCYYKLFWSRITPEDMRDAQSGLMFIVGPGFSGMAAFAGDAVAFLSAHPAGKGRKSNKVVSGRKAFTGTGRSCSKNDLNFSSVSFRTVSGVFLWRELRGRCT